MPPERTLPSSRSTTQLPCVTGQSSRQRKIATSHTLLLPSISHICSPLGETAYSGEGYPGALMDGGGEQALWDINQAMGRYNHYHSQLHPSLPPALWPPYTSSIAQYPANQALAQSSANHSAGHKEYSAGSYVKDCWHPQAAPHTGYHGANAMHAHSSIYNYHGPVHLSYIEKSDNTFTGTSYGQVIQNAAENQDWKEALAKRLKISRKADYKYYPEGNESGMRRSACTSGTRVEVIEDVMRWGSNRSPDSESIFWLSGQAGAGKTTITYTIAERFAKLCSDEVALGGSFFCSLYSMETMNPVTIIRTLAYQLALRSPTFRDALYKHGDFEAVDRGPRSQMDGLLIFPWKISEEKRAANREPCLVNTIDAIDELEGNGGFEFLKALLEVLNENPLRDLKFFVTSRLEPALVKRIEAFGRKQVFRLEKMTISQSSADIRAYLEAHLSCFASPQEIERLVEDAAGLFIHAATVVEYLKDRNQGEQGILLRQLLTLPASTPYPRGVTAKLDTLYSHILETSLVDPRDREDSHTFNQCLAFLHILLCSIERISTSIATHLLNAGRIDRHSLFHSPLADGVLSRLHSILYFQNGLVMWFHKSFPDFMFDERRSGAFYCNQDVTHQLLFRGCFEVMRRELRFNIANIPSSSYKSDNDNPTLSASIASNISPTLSYSCRRWSRHASLVPLAPYEPLSVILGDFLQFRVLFWIEAMSLLRLRGHCGAMLLKVQEAVVSASVNVLSSAGSRGIKDNLDDAAAFAHYFASNDFQISTPHLYISSLATFPRSSTLLVTWRQHFLGIPSFIRSSATVGEGSLSTTPVGHKLYAPEVSGDGKGEGQFLHSTKATIKSAVTSLSHSSNGKRMANDPRAKPAPSPDTGSEEMLQPSSSDSHTNSVSSVVYSPDGRYIASGSWDHTIRVWDAATGRQLMRLVGHTGRINSVAYSPDGLYIASGSGDGSARIWSASSGTHVEVFDHRPSTSRVDVDSVAYSVDGMRLITTAQKTRFVWNASTGQLLETLDTMFMGASRFSLRSGARHVFCKLAAAGSSWGVWDPEGGVVVQNLDLGSWFEVCSAAIAPDGKHVVCGSGFGSLSVWDLSSGGKLRVLAGHTKSVSQVVYSPDGKWVVSSSYDKTMRLWDPLSGELLNTFDAGCYAAFIRTMAFSPDGKHIAFGSDDKSIRVWGPCDKRPAYIREKDTMDRHTGWLVSLSDPSSYLMFVPLWENVPNASIVLSIPPSSYAHVDVDLSKARLGRLWTECYTPQQ